MITPFGNSTTGVHLYGDVSYSIWPIPFSARSGSIDLMLNLFSTKHTSASVRISYRTKQTDPWSGDMFLICNNTISKNGVLYGLSTSREGDTHTVKWCYSSNAISAGDTCQLRIEVLPAVTRSIQIVDDKTLIETSVGSSYKAARGTVPFGRFIRIDNGGDYIVSFEDKLFVTNEDGDILVESADTYENMLDVIHTRHDTYLILTGGDGSASSYIYEVDTNGVMLADYELALTPDYALGMNYDPVNETILYWVGTDLFEIDWRTNQWGTTAIWTASMTDNVLGAAYDVNRLIIWAALDTGELVKVDRTFLDDPVEITTIQLNYRDLNISLEDVGIPAVDRVWIHSTRGGLIFSGNGGVEQAVTTPRISVQRESSYQRDELSTKEDIVEFSNLVYSPVRNGMVT